METRKKKLLRFQKAKAEYLECANWESIKEPYYPTIHAIRQWSDILNTVLFAGKLPKYRKVYIGRYHKTLAQVVGAEQANGKRFAYLDCYIRFRSFGTFLNVLAHELVHLYEWVNYGRMSHGKTFHAQRDHLAKYGLALRTKYTN